MTPTQRLPTIDFDPKGVYLVAPIVGLIVGPPITIGMADEARIIRLSAVDESIRIPLQEALTRSLQSWGYGDGKSIPLHDPPLLWLQLIGTTDEMIRNGLIVGDVALALLHKKLSFGHPAYIAWSRLAGRAVGALHDGADWTPIERPNSYTSPAIIQQPPKDFWDYFLSIAVRNQIDAVGEALFRSLEWERAAAAVADTTHRFAFIWIALESAMPHGEVKSGDFVRRLSLLAAAPRGAASRIIMADPALAPVFLAHPNPVSKEWVKAIEEMYGYRCKIVHDGASAGTSSEIDPMKSDWFFHLSSFLNDRLHYLLADAVQAKVSSLTDFWDIFVIKRMYSSSGRWVKNGSLIEKIYIKHDWRKSKLPTM